MTANALLTLGLTNAVLATLLAIAGWCLTRIWKNPHVASVVWLVVLLKLVTPPVVPLPIVIDQEFAGSASPGPHGEPASVPITLDDREDARRAGGVSPPSTSPELPPPIAFDAIDEPLPHTTDEPLPFTSDELAFAPTPTAFDIPEVEQTSFDAAPLPTAPQETAEPVQTSPRLSIPLVLLIVWAIGSVAMTGLTTARIVCFRRCLQAAGVCDDDAQREARCVATRLKLSRVPNLCFVEASVGPMVWAGAFRPIVVVPRPLWTTLATEERETLLAHEFAHIARRDHWVRRFEAVVLALFWWLPTTWFAIRRREAAAESCCDALVLAAYPERPHEYAQALFHAVSLFSNARPLPLASGLGRITELKERLAMIAHDRVPTKPSRVVRLGLLLIALAALAVSTRFVLATPGDETKPLASGVVYPTSQPDLSGFNGEIGGGYGSEMMGGEPFGPIGGEESSEFFGADETAALGDFLPDEGSVPDDSGAASGFGPAAGSSAAGGSRGGGIPGMGSSRGFVAPFGRGGGARRSARGPQVRPSDEAITKMLAGLAKVIASPKEPAAVKIQALRSYGRLARGTSHAEEAEQVLLAAAKNANDDRTTLGIADALHALGSPKGVELMWKVFGKIPAEGENVEARQLAYRVLDNAESVPPTVESVRMVAEFVATNAGYGGGMMGAGMGGMPGGMGMMMSGPGRSTSLGPLNRLTASADGIRRLVEATVSMPQEIGGAMPDDGGSVSPQLTGLVGGAMMTDITPRNILLTVLKDTAPANEEIASALVEALASEDAGVRAAAAEALGNVSERERTEGAAAPAKPANRASIGAILSTPGSAAGGYGPAAAEKSTPAVSEEVRADLITSLSQAARDEKASPQSRIAALRSLAKYSQGTKHAAEVSALARAVAESADNENERQAAAEVAVELTPSDERDDAKWKAFPTASWSAQVAYLRDLGERRSTPPDAASALAVAKFLLIVSRSKAALREGEAEAYKAAADVLHRLGGSAKGVGILGDAARLAAEYDMKVVTMPPKFPEGAPRTEFTATELRVSLCSIIAAIEPSSDEVVVALSEALSSDDYQIREAAAKALGNIGSANRKAAASADDPQVSEAKKIFQLLDRDADGTASVEELSKLQKMRARFERAGVNLDEDMGENQFVDAYLKANQ